jgi:hypothetical protein
VLQLWPAGKVGPAWAELGRSGRAQERIQMELWFRISNEFEMWKDFEKFNKEI